MDRHYCTTSPSERKRGQHLRKEDRGAIQALKNQGLSNRDVARSIGCSPSTVANELKRGTPPRKNNKGRPPKYSAKHGEEVYLEHRAVCHRHSKWPQCDRFLKWLVKEVREEKWSLDACWGYARRHNLFSADEMVCTRTLYNMVWAGKLPIHVIELPEAVKRKSRKYKAREGKRHYGTSISERPAIAGERTEIGHWEGDTVVGKRAGKEAVILTLLEKRTQNYIAIRISGKTSRDVINAIAGLREEFGPLFSEVFKTITVDNGSEFADLSQAEQYGTKVYFAHPYTSWESTKRTPQWPVPSIYPKGSLSGAYTKEDILIAADLLNGRPRKKLGYRTPEEMFDEFPDAIYAI